MFSSEEILEIASNLPQTLLLNVFQYHQTTSLEKQHFEKLSKYTFEGGFYRFFSDYHEADLIWKALIIRDFGKPAWEISELYPELSLKECYLRHSRICAVENFISIFYKLYRENTGKKITYLAAFWNPKTFQNKFHVVNNYYSSCMAIIKLFFDLRKGDFDTPLTFLLREGSEHLIMNFLFSGLDVNTTFFADWEESKAPLKAKYKWSGETLLTYVIKEGRADVVNLLLSLGADPNLCPIKRKIDNYDLTPLTLACRAGKAEIAKSLLAVGADMGKVSADGTTPLSAAALSLSVNTVQVILEAGAQVYDKYYIERYYLYRLPEYSNEFRDLDYVINIALDYHRLLSSPGTVKKDISTRDKTALFKHMLWLVNRAATVPEKIAIIQKAMDVDYLGRPTNGLSRCFHKPVYFYEYIPFVPVGHISRIKAELHKLQPPPAFYQTTSFQVRLAALAILGIGLLLTFLPNATSMTSLPVSLIGVITVLPLTVLMIYVGVKMKAERKTASAQPLIVKPDMAKPRFIDTIFDETPASPDVLPLYRGKVNITREQEPASQSTDLVLRF